MNMEKSRQINSRFFALSDCYIFKSQLHEYTRIKGIENPEYETINEGPSHDPSFKSSVIVDNVRYDSLPGFSKRKDSEQSAAENALINLAKSENIKSLLQESGLCKQLLSHYAQKRKYSLPCYVCRYNYDFTAGKMGFTCAVTVGETQFTGASAKSKKAAKISAARAALLMFQTRKLGSEAKLRDNSQCTVVPMRRNKLHLTNKKSTCYKPRMTLEDVGDTGDVGSEGKGVLEEYPGKGLLGTYPGKVPVDIKHGDANMKRVLPTGTSGRSQDRAVNNSQQKDIPCTTKPNKLGLETKFPVYLFAALKTLIDREKVGEEEDLYGLQVGDSKVAAANPDEDIMHEPKNQLHAYKGPAENSSTVAIGMKHGVYSNLSTSMSHDGEASPKISISTPCSLKELLALPAAKHLEPIAPNSNLSSNEGGNMKTERIFVGGLPPTLTEDGFRQYFETYGHVTDVVIMHDPSTQRSRGSGFISFGSEEAVDRVLQKPFHVFKGKIAMVRRALPKDANPSSRGCTRHSGATGGYSAGAYGNPCGPQAFRYEGAAAGTGGSLSPSAATRTIF